MPCSPSRRSRFPASSLPAVPRNPEWYSGRGGLRTRLHGEVVPVSSFQGSDHDVNDRPQYAGGTLLRHAFDAAVPWPRQCELVRRRRERNRPPNTNWVSLRMRPQDKERSVVTELVLRFLPPAEVDQVEHWTCRCGRPFDGEPAAER